MIGTISCRDEEPGERGLNSVTQLNSTQGIRPGNQGAVLAHLRILFPGTAPISFSATLARLPARDNVITSWMSPVLDSYSLKEFRGYSASYSLRESPRMGP